MIEVQNLTKTYGDVVAVDDVTFTVRPGVVTGFLGPNGAGKSTTMRMILGLDRPTSGTVAVNGRPYQDAVAPIAEVGALVEARAVDGRRSARNHLRAIAATVGIGDGRVDEVLELVGLTDVARKPAGGFSLGMGQRLGIASALLADPDVVMLDEPVNGLDPDGILWIRGLLKQLAAEGRTVFLSSHLMSEMQMTAEHLIVIGQGRILADEPLHAMIDRAAGERVDVVSPDGGRLAELLADDGVVVTSAEPGVLQVTGVAAERIGDVAAENGVRLHQLHTVEPSLEQAFMDMTAGAVTYRGGREDTPR
ncbi:ABC-2 type transport system ATP-binding protein [Paraoerskovia marina]|uniref:ABC-2 type transport system ATP-binding protein n=1 Tax=Paraoerskovia marina TaxID=545619 RepID=A0A1H1MLS3_9CELL|nr:ATP-binding cassette domain-containing protein [Paraoerskovia marina]SDR87325.1 ABC-2 type transport system ATP-binding protein [Paraoerskovia marina]